MQRYPVLGFGLGLILVGLAVAAFFAGRVTVATPTLPDQTGVRSATTTMGALLLASIPVYVPDTDGFPKYVSAKQLPSGKWSVVESVVVALPDGDTYTYVKYWLKALFTATGEPLNQGKVIRRLPWHPRKPGAA